MSSKMELLKTNNKKQIQKCHFLHSHLQNSSSSNTAQSIIDSAKQVDSPLVFSLLCRVLLYLNTPHNWEAQPASFKYR